MLRTLCPSLLLCAGLALPLAAATTPPPDGDGDGRPVQQIEPVHLGVIPDTTSEAFDGTRGVLVKEIEPGSTADGFGLRAGDLITHFNNQPILRLHDLMRAKSAARIGNEASITVKRGDRLVDLEGTLKGKLRPQDIRETMAAAEDVKHVISQSRGNPNDLGRNLRYLAVALNELPDRIEQAAKEFKRVYPHGEFTVNVEIRINSNKTDADPLSIRLGEEGEIPEQLLGDAVEESDEQDDTAVSSDQPTDADAEDTAENDEQSAEEADQAEAEETDETGTPPVPEQP